MRIGILLPLAIAAIAAPGGARNLNQVPAATPAGKPVDCIQLDRIRETHIRNDSVIDFEMTGGTTYRNTFPRACPQLGFERRYLHRTTLDELCSTDTITVLYSHGEEGPTCQIGQFQPVKIALH